MNLISQLSEANQIDDCLNQVATKTHVPKKKYSTISSEVRKKFIKKVLDKESTMTQAAKEFGLKFSTGKAILRIYKKYGRIGKKATRNRQKTQVLQQIKDQIKVEPSSQQGLSLQDFGSLGQEFLFCQSLVNSFFSQSNDLSIEKKDQATYAFINNLQMLVGNPELNITINKMFEFKKNQILSQQQQKLIFLQCQPKQEEQTLLFNLFQKNNLITPTNNSYLQ